MFIKINDLWQYPIGTRLVFTDLGTKDLIYLGVNSKLHEKMFWDKYKIIYENEIIQDYNLDEEKFDDLNILIYEFSSDSLKDVYNALLSNYISFSVQDPEIMKEEIEKLKTTLNLLKEIL